MHDSEIELKFELDPAAAARLEQDLLALPGAKGPPDEQTLVSTYFDTPDGDLLRAGYVLRVRQVGERRVQTVKSEAAGLSTRGEWECDIAGDAPDLAAAAATPLGPVLERLDAPLGAVFVTRVQRRRRVVRQGPSRIEAAIDQGRIEAGGRVRALCELELELVSGPAEQLYVLARRLAKATPLRLSFISKSERGFRLARGEAPSAPVPAAPVRLTPEMTARQAFQAAAAGALRQWTAAAAVLEVTRSPQAVHQLRVGLRRLRTAMTLFQPLTADPGYVRLISEIRWLAGELDLARDIDVFIDETFRPAARRLHDQAGLAGLGADLHRARTRAYDRMIETLSQPRALALVLDMAAWIDGGRWADPADAERAALADGPVEALARAGLRRLRRQIKRRGEALKTLDDAGRHHLRIRAKRLRYALEFFGGLYDGRREDRRRDMLAALKALQDSLGALNDMAVARARGLALADGDDAEPATAELQTAEDRRRQAFAAGLAVGLRLTEAEPLLKRAARAYDALMAVRPCWRD